MARSLIRFLRGDQLVELADVDPNETLLDYLRLRARDTGTKEGCAEGDCGACTVVLGRLRDGVIHYRPVNACITLLGMIDGAELVTVDDLAGPGEALHPVQRALVERHGSQCGFCTPGMVMSLFALYHDPARGADGVNPALAADRLAGNLCRCTGYGPILQAAGDACAGPPDDGYSQGQSARAARLLAMDDGLDLFLGDDHRFFHAPASRENLAEFYARHPDATLVAGATDVGLWITKGLRDLPKIIHLGRVAGFDAVSEAADHVHIGAGASYARAEAALGAIDADIATLLRRIGSEQIRTAGSIGGNLANGSPIGDMAPVLIALDAQMELVKGGRRRHLAVEDFFIDYGRQDRQPGEFVDGIRIPRLGIGQHFRCYKISKRRDQDISALLGACRLTVADGHVAEARLAFGGMAAIPKRARAAEAALMGQDPADPDGWRPAAAALAEDFQPLDDFRASAAYRLDTAAALIRKAMWEIGGSGGLTRIEPRAEVAAHD